MRSSLTTPHFRGRSVLLPLTALATSFTVLLGGCAAVKIDDAASGQQAAAAVLPTKGAPSEATTVAFVTDFGNCDKGEQEVADMVSSWKPEAIYTGGDNTQKTHGCIPYEESVWKYYSHYAKDPSNPRFFPAIGNHDYENKGAGLKVYQAGFPYLPKGDDKEGRWYHKRFGYVRMFMVDSLDASTFKEQKAWLKTALNKSRRESPEVWNIVVFHTPAYTSGPHPANQAMRIESGWDYKAWGADMVLSGHQHLYEDFIAGGLHFVTVGTGASELSRPCPETSLPGSQNCFSDYGAVKIEADAHKLTFQFFSPKAQYDLLLDSIVLTR